MRLRAAVLSALLLLPTASLASTIAGVPPGTPFVDIVLGNAPTYRLLLPAVDNDGNFRASGDLVLCDGSVREGLVCDANLEASLSFTVAGSIFPEIVGNLTFTDNGGPTTLSATFSTLIPAISGLATTSIEGSITVPADRTGPAVTSPLASGAFVEGLVAGGSLATVADVGADSITLGETQQTKTYGPVAGTYDCGLVGGCTLIALAMGINGLGGSNAYTITGRFDIDAAADPAVIPLPASAWLLGAGLLGLIARRRRG